MAGTGRVFKVCDTQGSKYTLKIAIGDAGVTSLTLENKQQELLQKAHTVLPTISKFLADSKRRWATLLLSPVGRQLQPTMSDIRLALGALRTLARANLKHGDCRRQNVVIVDKYVLAPGGCAVPRCPCLANVCLTCCHDYGLQVGPRPHTRNMDRRQNAQLGWG